jgi:ubiquinone/menaquinone biosynthesis C-methylase UbiE
MKSNNFNRVAFIYDTLARIVFGDSLRKAQRHWLHQIPAKSKVLVLGSGTGWIANEVLAAKPDAQVTLVDASQKMTTKAQRMLKNKPVTVLCADETQPFAEPFDAIILPFFLDTFPTEKLEQLLSQIGKNAHAGTLWLVTDFISETRWHKIYLWIMYRFFRITCSIEATTIPDWQDALNRKHKLQGEVRFFGSFISATLFTQ